MSTNKNREESLSLGWGHLKKDNDFGNIMNVLYITWQRSVNKNINTQFHRIIQCPMPLHLMKIILFTCPLHVYGLELGGYGGVFGTFDFHHSNNN